MYFEDIVNIKEADCCEKCISFEYDLPCQVNKDLVQEIAKLFKHEEQIPNLENLLKYSTQLKIEKEENLKVELKLGSRYFKLCLPSGDLITKDEIEDLLSVWISNTLNITIERKNG